MLGPSEAKILKLELSRAGHVLVTASREPTSAISSSRVSFLAVGPDVGVLLEAAVRAATALRTGVENAE